MLYVPVVNTRLVTPGRSPKTRDFIYLSNIRPGKRDDILLDAVRGTAFTEVMRSVLADRDRATPLAYFETTWATVQTLDSYLAFFRRMGWTG